MKKLKPIFLSTSILVGLGSCVQRYDAPPLPTPTVSTWKSQQKNDDEKPHAVCPDPEQVLVEASFRPWWKVFNDPILNDLEYHAIKDSPKVQGAVGRLEQAMARYGITRASLYPEIDLAISATRQRISGNGAGGANVNSAIGAGPAGANLVSKSPDSIFGPGAAPPQVCAPVPPPMCACPPPKTPKPITHITSLSVLPILTYDLDFWGKNWQATESAMAQVRAEQEDLQNTLLQLTTSVADSYLQTRTYDSELEILNRTLGTR
ncbi:MAG: TolC family protein, partial [Chlamydiales bacterium]|nr:TolC family protein [Chlamydiales bacterium]